MCPSFDAGYQQFNGGAVHNGWSGKTSGLQSMLTSQHPPIYSIVAMQAEVRTIEFWRSIICECTATFFYVLIVCSVATITEVANDPVRQTTYCALRYDRLTAKESLIQHIINLVVV